MMALFASGRLLMLGGALIAALGCLWLLVTERRRMNASPTGTPAAREPREQLHRGWWVILVLAIVVGTAVRLNGLGDKGISHQEVYVPGIDLPAGISEPPPRHAFAETAAWHFHAEPHPFGWYLGMWGWTKVFGTSLAMMRLPQVLMGIAGIWLIFLVGTLASGARVGIVSAALLALHGSNIFWSQSARMYGPGATFGLLSTYLLLRMSREDRPPLWQEAAYVVTTLATALTVEFTWPLLCVQILWIGLLTGPARTRRSRLASLQSLAFIVAAPMLSHASLLGRGDAAPPPTLDFLTSFFSFGFLFNPGAFSETTTVIPLVASAAVFIASAVLMVAGLRTRMGSPVKAEAPALDRRAIVVTAIGVAMMMFGVVFNVDIRRGPLTAVSTLPLFALLLPMLADVGVSLIARVFPAVARWPSTPPAWLSLVAIQAIVPTILLFIASFAVTVAAPRAFQIFIPYVLILVAAGIVALARSPLRAIAIGVPIAAVFTLSTVMLRQVPNGPRDYQGLARAINAKLLPGDMIFVPPKDWMVTPMFYYLDGSRLVGSDYAGALRRNPTARVWTILGDSLKGNVLEGAGAWTVTPQGQPPAILAALVDHKIAAQLDEQRIHALLYVPNR